MKRSVLFLLILLLLIIPLTSSVAIEAKSKYSQGETIIAKVSGNFITSIQESNIFFYRGHVRIPMSYDLGKVGDDYYIKASLIGKTENNYSIIIKNAQYYEAGRISSQDIISNFSITNETADFAIDPGFAITQGSFSIKTQSLKDNSLTIKIDVFSGINASSSISLSSGQIKTINFDTNSLTKTTNDFIKLSSNGLIYNIPVYFTYIPPQQQPQPYCGDKSIDSGEQCDTNDWGTIKNCLSFGFNNGTLSCNAPGTTNECTFDISNCFNTSIPITNNTNNTNNTGCTYDFQCSSGKACVQGSCATVQDQNAVCGNNKVELGEQCDGSDWNGLQGCSDFSFNNGTLSCTNCVFNVNSCFNTIEETCIYNTDCSQGQVCSKRQCVPAPQCIYNSDCNSGYYCSANVCAKIAPDCTYDNDCADGYQCKEQKCVQKPKEDECKTDSDCEFNKICSNNFCVDKKGTECVENSDCKSGYLCNQGYCFKKKCQVDYDCRYGYYCDKENFICVKKECTTTFDCNYGKVCVNNACLIKEGSQCSTNSQCSSGKTCARGNCINQSKVSTNPEIVKTCNDVGGQICADNNECTGNYRTINANGETAVCCLSSCAEKKTSSSTKVIGWALIGFIFLIIIVFFKLKAKKTKSVRV